MPVNILPGYMTSWLIYLSNSCNSSAAIEPSSYINSLIHYIGRLGLYFDGFGKHFRNLRCHVRTPVTASIIYSDQVGSVGVDVSIGH